MEKNPDKFAGSMASYHIIESTHLPNDVVDELCNDSPGNDAGRIENPAHRPNFKAWLESENMPIHSYIVWWSW